MVYIFLADGFEEVEAITPIDYLRRAQIDVTVVGVTGKTVTGAHKIDVACDITLDEFSENSPAEMIVLPGGLVGVENLEKCEKLEKIITNTIKNNKYIAAICAAPTILAKRGLLAGKKAVCYPSMKEFLGDSFVEESVVTHGNFITSKAAGTAEQFALELINVLKGKQTADSVKESIFAR